MTSLTERAERATTGGFTPPTPAAEVYPAPEAGTGLDITDTEVVAGDYPAPESIPVHLAWLRVRHDVRFVGKVDEHKEKNSSGREYVKYKFRGVESALNAFGPATLRHGVNIVATDMVATYRDTKSSQGKPMRECTVLVTWQVIGPMGDSLPLGKSAGESLDSGDKGTAKAQSLALRALLFNTGLIPTGEPEPEVLPVERGEAPTRTANDYRDEIINPKTSRGRLEQISYELRAAQMLHVLVQNETGNDESLDSLGMRHYNERSVPAGGAE